MSEIHRPYELRTGHPCDFKVKYRILSEREGGRKTLPQQGIRWDFWYEHSDHQAQGHQLFVIWPEFEDDQGRLIPSGVVPQEGVARMWILNPKFRVYHNGRIVIGTRGWFREGPLSTGECEVIELVGLATNPKE